MSPPRGPGLAWLDALTIFLGSFLLFQLQPLFSKWILPWFGGGPEVWTTCLVFFQTALFAGYAYAWGCERLLRGWGRVAVHGTLVVVAAGLLPIGPERIVRPAGGESPAGGILLLLSANVGAPFILLASTGPLVQAWYSHTYPGRSPYRLYSLSNAGSLAALLSYPFLIEPRWGLRFQSQGWSVLCAGFCAMSVSGMVLQGRVPPPAPKDSPEETDLPPSGWLVVLWIGLSATASGMLVAATSHLGHDVAVIPFLWVLPLASYLISFILAFDCPRAFLPRIYASLSIGTVVLSVVIFVLRATAPWLVWLSIGTTLATLFLVCMLCHGTLARLKPSSRFLTSYYLAIAGGGALGGAAVSLLAPRLFSTVLEWKLGMGMAYGGSWVLLAWTHRGFLRSHLNIGACFLVVAVLGLGFISTLFASYGRKIESARNFYGAILIVDSPAGKSRPLGFRDMASGRVLHGRQYLDAAHRRTPTTYYLGTSGIGRALNFYRTRPDLRVGVVGLGVGTIAAYGDRPSQLFRFYEINPDVIRLARTYFTFLGDCPARVEIVPGDARLSLEGESPQAFHVLVLDAFSGDTVPTHLLTVEAMQTWLGHLVPDGTIAVHVSNRYLDLEPVIRGVARQCGLRTVGIELDPPEGEDAQGSLWILCTRSEPALKEWLPYRMQKTDPREFIWSDDRSDLFSIFRMHRGH